MSRAHDQLSLFDEPAPAVDARRQTIDDALATGRARAAGIAAGLPDALALGTSSWTFPGWAGIVYPSGVTGAALGREGLRHYARHPLLRTVGIDRTYYAPIALADLRAYADQLPADFRCCIKAPAAVTSRVVPTFGGRREAPRENADFLSVPRLIEDLLGPLAAAFARHSGPIVLEFPPHPRGWALDATAFAERLDRFLEALPHEFTYAVELRDRALLTPTYRRVLGRHGVAHTYNYWSAMPMPLAQAAVVPPGDAPISVVRLLLKPGTWYEDQRHKFAPFDRLVEPDEVMRNEVVALTTRALSRGRKVYVLVNNKAEGSSPLTIEALAERLRVALTAPASSEAAAPLAESRPDPEYQT